MLAGFEHATWLASYCYAQECLYKEYFANNDKYFTLNNAFTGDLVDVYESILTFLLQAHSYYTKGAAGDSLPIATHARRRPTAVNQAR
jgi:hypothetical protein